MTQGITNETGLSMTQVITNDTGDYQCTLNSPQAVGRQLMVGRYAAAFIKLTLCRKVSEFLFANMVIVELSKRN